MGQHHPKFLSIWSDQLKKVQGFEHTRELILLAWAYAQNYEDDMALSTLQSVMDDEKYLEKHLHTDIEYVKTIRDAVTGLIETYGIDFLTKPVDGQYHSG